MTPSEREAIMQTVLPVARVIAHLPLSHRIILLQGVLMQEVCNHPHREREDVFREIEQTNRMIFDATERGMQEQLAKNAREGQ